MVKIVVPGVTDEDPRIEYVIRYLTKRGVNVDIIQKGRPRLYDWTPLLRGREVKLKMRPESVPSASASAHQFARKHDIRVSWEWWTEGMRFNVKGIRVKPVQV